MTHSVLTTSRKPRLAPAQLPAEFRILEASATSDFQLIQGTDDGAEGSAPKLRKFTMTAYTGGKMLLGGFPYPVVVDLAGLKVPAKNRPILRDHDIGRIVGHTESIDINGSSIRLAGVLSGSNGYSKEVADSGDNGFPWQASIGASANRMVFVDKGESIEVNARKFTGPLYVARQATLREVSFVALGADDQTVAQMVASPSSSLTIEVLSMEFEQWVVEQGFEPNALTPPQTASLRAMYERQSAPVMPSTPEPVPPTPPTPTSLPVAKIVGPGNSQSSDDDGIAAMRTRKAAELRRQERIATICGGRFTELEARAIEEDWDENRTELEVLRASRPAAPAVNSGAPALTSKILEAAAWLSAGIEEDQVLRQFGERTIEAAHPFRRIGLQELVAECASLEGKHVPRVFGDGTETIRAGFSTISLPGILESVMTRTMLDAYEGTPIAALQLCAVGSVSDFKEISRYRLLGTGGFEKVAPAGELKAGALSETRYGNKAETYGQVLMLTRQDIINDDLEAFLSITEQMGRSGAELIDELFFNLLLSNPNSFFSTNNANYLSGADTAFGSDALTKAKTLFRKQKAGPGTKPKDLKPINIRPKYLVVPVEIETDAELLMGAAQLMIDASGTATKIPVDNPHRNKYEIVSAPHLSDSYYTGNSAKAWYLFADPNLVPAFEIVFLNGKKTPVIERIEAPPTMLGMGFRSYLDTGIREQESRGAVKVKGEA